MYVSVSTAPQFSLNVDSKALSTVQQANTAVHIQEHTHRTAPRPLNVAVVWVPVLVCVEQGDTAVRVSSLRAQGVGVIRPDHNESSSL